ncbi:hypothetical protein D3227_28070 [Mesorhizobium waimense]|uniref:Uncharacterized protein n=1 Tax=Mesorhizobium waimense TaxID=1300307 RepID=A0A3A5KHB6_9HYPH|nr:hypothetical protein D3227_28070 [Mesorhizobium waimense]
MLGGGLPLPRQVEVGTQSGTQAVGTKRWIFTTSAPCSFCRVFLAVSEQQIDAHAGQQQASGHADYIALPVAPDVGGRTAVTA